MKAPDLLEKIVKAPPTQTDSSSGNLPPPLRPTYQGPTGDDPLRYTVPFVPGMYPQAPSLQQDYSPKNSERPLHESN